MITWVVSNDLGARSKISDFIEAIKKNGDHIFTVSLEETLTPSYIPAIDAKKPVVFYGPVNFITRMHNLKQFTPGVFGDNDLFSYQNLISNIPSGMLFNNPEESFSGNSTFILDKLKDLSEDTELFFKPGDDSKFIVGSVCTVKHIRNICKNILSGIIPDTNNESPLLVSPIYGPGDEYRLFIVDGKIVSGSQYSPKESVSIPEIVYNFAYEVLKKWNPVPFFILDICISNGNPYIMEIQNFHSAGFYLSNLDNIVNSVSKYTENNFNGFLKND